MRRRRGVSEIVGVLTLFAISMALTAGVSYYFQKSYGVPSIPVNLMLLSTPELEVVNATGYSFGVVTYVEVRLVGGQPLTIARMEAVFLVTKITGVEFLTCEYTNTSGLVLEPGESANIRLECGVIDRHTLNNMGFTSINDLIDNAYFMNIQVNGIIGTPQPGTGTPTCIYPDCDTVCCFIPNGGNCCRGIIL